MRPAPPVVIPAYGRLSSCWGPSSDSASPCGSWAATTGRTTIPARTATADRRRTRHPRRAGRPGGRSSSVTSPPTRPQSGLAARGTRHVRLELGTPVHCSDRKFGELTDVVIDPGTRSVTHLVVKSHHVAEGPRLVPISLV